MANVYVSAAGSSTSPFDTWAKAGSLTSALGVAVAGDDIWVAATHSETSSSAITYTFAGTAASPNRCIAASTVSGNAPPVSSDLVSSASPVIASGSTGQISLNGTFYTRGVAFNSGGAISTAGTAANFQKYELCTMSVVGGNSLTVSGSNGSIWLENTPISFNNSAASISGRGKSVWRNTINAIAGTPPTTLFSNSAQTYFIIEGVDLSAVTGTICGNGSGGPQTFFFKDCKINASASVLPATSITAGLSTSEAYVVRCDSGATTYRQEKHNYCADLIQNISITRTGGATDGTAPICWQITTTANSKWYNNFQSFPISVWNTTVGSSVNVVVHATSNIAAGGFPTNADIWIDVEYLGSSSNPQGSFTTNTISNVLTAASNYTSDGATWANAPAGGTFAMSVSITPQLAGPITVYVRCAKVSTIFYVDPLIASA